MTITKYEPVQENTLYLPLRASKGHGVTPAAVYMGGRVVAFVSGPNQDQIAEFIAMACNLLGHVALEDMRKLPVNIRWKGHPASTTHEEKEESK